MPIHEWELKPEELREVCSAAQMGFETTDDLEIRPEPVMAQYRAMHALEIGLGMKDPDFNLFVSGLARSGRTEMIKAHVERLAAQEETPPDYVYVFNFKEPEKPRALRLPTGMGKTLRNDVDELINTLKVQLPEVFESEDYSNRREALVNQFTRERNNILKDLDEQATAEGFILNISQAGMMIFPGREGKPLTEEEIKALSDAEREELRQKSTALHTEMNEALRKIRKMEKEFQLSEKKLDQDVALFVVGHLIEELIEKYQQHPAVTDYLKQLEEDILKNVDDLKRRPGAPQPFPFPAPEPSFVQYQVNVFVDNSETKGAPVIVEHNPTYPNLFGSIERRAQFGALLTDFTLIHPGALHRANGGYLIINALDLLKWYYSYEALKRTLKERVIKIEDLGEQLGLITTKSLRPEPIPLHLKVILIGSPWIYQLLYNYDEDFHKHFKIKADFDWIMKRTPHHLERLISFVRSYTHKEGLPPLHNTAVARLVEYASEMVGHKYKLTLQVQELADIIKEANFWASKNGHTIIHGDDMEKAVSEKIFRSDLFEEKMQDYIQEGMLFIETSGSVVGQINGLSVYMLGDYAFARPSRITATVSLGKEGVVAIERESKLSGNIHTKGVMILSSFLRSRFAKDKPLTLSAHLTFEQSYGMVDGDSASAAELIALLSCLAEAPLAQNIAMTGSVSQRGEFQPIGGVNWKVEGFYKVCKARGLDGGQGVIIPKSNVQELMLRQEVVDSVRAGLFHVWAVSSVDEALEILTGLPAGAPLPEGGFPPDTLNARVDQKLRFMMETARKLMKEEEGKKGDE
ncbi:Lon protease family protein [Desulfobacca acetoxidans]|uniref:endopeptidase La n=1 Tax=Desulfobacca acetoxidans (strain ATCC 700848 / DSM 11109 / ASRB2) TaxID=880072 RepID=F2NC72_DESAR|nr:ATP-binding protein [Desulfobacca acetoxidans]AEB08867.1 peptidase S16 lon domain protein [Desulfobacca acetoxidans DSM 11109]